MTSKINLVVGDYFAVETIYIKHSKAACELITWLRSKTYILAHLKEVQVQTGKRVCAVIRAVLTRWTAHYLAFSRLLEFQHPLKSLVNHDAMVDPDKKILTPSSGTAASKRKAHEMVAIIEDPVFWHALARLKTHLEPLARAANVAQAAFCRLDQILLTFGSLCMHYDNLRTNDPANCIGCTAIIDSIEKRWDKADQDVFIAAVILNPFIKTAPFSSQSRLITQASILSLLKRLYSRFFSITEEEEELKESLQRLYSDLEGYLDAKGRGVCEGLGDYALAIEEHAKTANLSPDPLAVYKGMSIAGEPPPPLFKLADHILSICPNSASCERLFSIFGNTLTKLRNRLGNQTLTSLAELKMHIRDEHVHDGEMKKRVKRFFGNSSHSTNAASTLPLAPPASTSQPPDTALEPARPLSSAIDNENHEMDIDPAMQLETPDSASDSLDHARNDFSRIVESFTRLAEGDEDEGDVQMPSHISIEICKLFDFNKSHWVSMHERSASRSLDEELELYELLDMDAPGEEDVNLEVDNTLDSVLHV